MIRQTIYLPKDAAQRVVKQVNPTSYLVYLPIEDLDVEAPMVKCLEFVYDHKPTLLEIGESLNNALEEHITDKILNGYTWNENQVYLSQQNQFDYKMLYDYSKEHRFANLPVVVRFGETSNTTLYEIETKEDFQSFYEGMVKHIQGTLKEGWDIKQKPNWEFIQAELDK